MRSARSLLAGNAPFDLLSWPVLAAGSAAHAAGIRDFGYAIRLATRIAEWWKKSGRRPVLPLSATTREAA